MWAYEVRILSFSENGENGLGDEGADALVTLIVCRCFYVLFNVYFVYNLYINQINKLAS